MALSHQLRYIFCCCSVRSSTKTLSSSTHPWMRKKKNRVNDGFPGMVMNRTFGEFDSFVNGVGIDIYYSSILSYELMVFRSSQWVSYGWTQTARQHSELVLRNILNWAVEYFRSRCNWFNPRHFFFIYWNSENRI